MVDVDKAVVAKMKKSGKTFEILVDSDAAIALREGKDIDVRDVLAAENIFDDAKKGYQSSPKDLEMLFHTDDVLEVAKEIIMKGDVPVSAEHRNEEQEQKWKKLVYLIHRNAVDPQDRPIPSERIEDAMKQAKVHLDTVKPAEEQMGDVVHKILPIIPLKMEIKEMKVRVPPQYAEKSYGVLKSLGKMKNEEWKSDGGLSCVIQIPGGLEDEFYDKLNSITHGNNEVEILNK